MFSLEIDFHDGISPPETILVRRSNAIVGSSDLAHVVVDGAASSQCELRLVRGLGREFSCFPVRRPGTATSPPPFVEGTYSADTELKLGDLTFHVTALDIDLMMQPDEFPDKAALRILRSALTSPSPLLPAVAVLGTKPIFLSFPAGQVLLVGRSRRCGLRLDAPDVSSDHARIGVEQNQAWVEDLGSTNGTLVNGEKISGRRYLDMGDRIGIGAEFILVPVLGLDELSMINMQDVDAFDTSETASYPSVVASGAEVRPTRRVIKEGEAVTIGRDPACDIWINAAHISRNHLTLQRTAAGALAITDLSSNGTYLNEERLARGELRPLEHNFISLDLSEGVRLGICFSEEDEERFFGRTDDVSESPVVEAISSSGGLRQQIAAVMQDQNSESETVDPVMRGEAERTGAFHRFAEKQRKQGYPADQYASEYLDPEGDDQFLPHEGAGRNRTGSGAYQYAGADSLGAGGANQAHLELDLLSPEEIDDELLRTPYFEGVSRKLLAVLVMIVVIFVLLLFISIFNDRLIL